MGKLCNLCQNTKAQVHQVKDENRPLKLPEINEKEDNHIDE